MVKMTLKADLEINPYYIASFLNSELGNLQALRKVTGTTRIALDYQAIKSIKIPIPPREMQDRIAGLVLDARKKAEELRQQAEKVVQDSKEQVKRHIMGK